MAGTERETPIDLRGVAACSRLVTTLELPDGFEPMAVPENCSFASGGCYYRANYRVEGETPTAEREIVIPGEFISPERYVEFKAFLESSLQDLQAPVLLR
ncbi:MAG: hypothetical protein GF405_03700 [Candidatus Eisenbacteria bacterium]|nr:hypothetical protein [Candidatus Eisenbacteria bacterium]